MTSVEFPGAAVRERSIHRFDRALRFLCALVVAVVTTFHVCDLAVAQVVDVAAAVSDTAADGESSTDVLVVEKCHICAVVSLPAIITSEDGAKITRPIPAGTTLRITPFHRLAVGPPPRT